jgi:hypothetical protein
MLHTTHRSEDIEGTIYHILRLWISSPRTRDSATLTDLALFSEARNVYDGLVNHCRRGITHLAFSIKILISLLHPVRRTQ